MNQKPQKNKLFLFFDLYKEDMIAFVTKFLPMLLFVYLVIKVPFLSRKLLTSELDTTTIGIIDTVVIKKGIVESQYGGRIQTRGCEVAYHFMANGKKIASEEYISKKSVSVKDFSTVLLWTKGDSVQIRYDSKGFKRSKIVF